MHKCGNGQYPFGTKHQIRLQLSLVPIIIKSALIKMQKFKLVKNFKLLSSPGKYEIYKSFILANGISFHCNIHFLYMYMYYQNGVKLASWKISYIKQPESMLTIRFCVSGWSVPNFLFASWFWGYFYRLGVLMYTVIFCGRNENVYKMNGIRSVNDAAAVGDWLNGSPFLNKRFSFQNSVSIIRQLSPKVPWDSDTHTMHCSEFLLPNKSAKERHYPGLCKSTEQIWHRVQQYFDWSMDGDNLLTVGVKS